MTSLVAWNQNVTDSQGRKQGEWIKRSDDGKRVIYKGTFKNDKPVGKFFYYYPQGNVSTVLEHLGEGKSKCRMYHSNGSIMAVGNYIDQKKDSTWWYFNDKKIILKQENYKNGVLDGAHINYFPLNEKKPRIAEEVYYRNGRKEGPWKQYFLSGKIKAICTYKMGLRQGKIIYYFESGEKDVEGYYKDGLKNGYWTFTNEEGDKEKHYYLRDKEIKGEELEKHLQSLKNK